MFLYFTNLKIYLYRCTATEGPDLFFKGYSSTHLLNRSTTVRTYLAPASVSGNGPIKSMPTISSGRVTFIGCSLGAITFRDVPL